jgi:1-acyl-sn-glycerol-3-phosphate acyltransferase
MILPLQSSTELAVIPFAATQATAVASHISPWLTPLAYVLGRYLLMPFYFGQIRVTGREYLPAEGPVILAPTHRSRWDAFVVPYAAGRDITGRDLHFMVSINEMRGVQGWFIRRMGGFALDPLHPTIASLKHSLDLLRDGQTLVIFPEGAPFCEYADFPSRAVYPLKSGLARLALQAETHHPGLGIQIVPLYIQYHPPIPRWRNQIHIHIGHPLPVAAYCAKGNKQAAQQLSADLEVALQKLQPLPSQEPS